MYKAQEFFPKTLFSFNMNLYLFHPFPYVSLHSRKIRDIDGISILLETSGSGLGEEAGQCLAL